MNQPVIRHLTFLVSGILAGFVCTLLSLREVKARRIILERDLNDTASMNISPDKAKYDPYFIRLNHSVNSTFCENRANHSQPRD